MWWCTVACQGECSASQLPYASLLSSQSVFCQMLVLCPAVHGTFTMSACAKLTINPIHYLCACMLLLLRHHSDHCQMLEWVSFAFEKAGLIPSLFLWGCTAFRHHDIVPLHISGIWMTGLACALCMHFSQIKSELSKVCILFQASGHKQSNQGWLSLEIAPVVLNKDHAFLPL